MELRDMTIDELQARQEELRASIETCESIETLEEMRSEFDSIKEELEVRKAEEAKKAEIRAAVANGAGKVIETFEKVEERKTMDIKEIRSSEAYVNAFAEYIKNGDDRECRAIITENGGTIEGMTNIPVPVIVDEIVRTAWEKNEILKRVKKTYIKGNLKVAYEAEGDSAIWHDEGDGDIDEENLTLGIVTMVPKMVKKWIRISDEAVAMGGEAFLRYVYDELTYQIILAIEKNVLELIVSAAQQGGIFATAVPVTAFSVTTIAEMLATLSAEATEPVAIMSRSTWALFKQAAAAASYAIDPFEGLPVIFVNTARPMVIVGDLKGFTVNYPEGEDVLIKWDDLTEATADMVRVIGRQYVALAPTSPKAFAVAVANTNGSDNG